MLASDAASLDGQTWTLSFDSLQCKVTVLMIAVFL